MKRSISILAAGALLAGCTTKLQWSKPPPKPTGGTTAAGVQPRGAVKCGDGGAAVTITKSAAKTKEIF